MEISFYVHKNELNNINEASQKSDEQLYMSSEFEYFMAKSPMIECYSTNYKLDAWINKNCILVTIDYRTFKKIESILEFQ